ncbi:hypothetical protein DFH09DRAFT_1110268 [Mycena vulgaris]|nr:hypothetical protein DFH09DRAFT_1110268 [Mycena vulgaris]
MKIGLPATDVLCLTFAVFTSGLILNFKCLFKNFHGRYLDPLEQIKELKLNGAEDGRAESRIRGSDRGDRAARFCTSNIECQTWSGNPEPGIASTSSVHDKAPARTPPTFSRKTGGLGKITDFR